MTVKSGQTGQFLRRSVPRYVFRVHVLIYEETCVVLKKVFQENVIWDAVRHTELYIQGDESGGAGAPFIGLKARDYVHSVFLLPSEALEVNGSCLSSVQHS